MILTTTTTTTIATSHTTTTSSVVAVTPQTQRRRYLHRQRQIQSSPSPPQQQQQRFTRLEIITLVQLVVLVVLLLPYKNILPETNAAAAAASTWKHPLQHNLHQDRELYSYDDTYYSDIHFYNTNDDDDASSSSSSSNSKTTNVLPSNIDWTMYALKYVSCANVKTWRSVNTNTNDYYNDNNNNNAENDDDENDANDILVQRTLVVVRLCPATSCSSYNVKGCNSKYGAYVLPASQYLQMIHSYYINQASMEKYCSVCDACMSYVTTTSTNAPTASPTTTTYDDDYYNNRRRQLAYGDDYFNDDAYGSSSSSYKYKPWFLDDTYQCMYQTVCQSYTNKCKKYLQQQQQQENYNNNNDDTTGSSSSSSSSSSATTATMTNTTFGQCIAFRGDGSGSSSSGSTDYYYYYASPHCASDGRTLHVGLYADPNCTVYVKSTGSSNPFASYTTGLSCLSCNYYDSSESSYALIPDTAITWQSTNNNESSSSSSLLLSTNHPLCSNLYNASAHCNTKLTTPLTGTNSTMVLSNYTAAEDEVVCPYIESLEDNMYDAYGDVILLKSSMYGLFSPFWRRGNGVASDTTDESSINSNQNTSKHRTIELGMLFVSMCIFCSLSIHAYTLRKKLLSRTFISWTSTTSPHNTTAAIENETMTETSSSYSMFPFWNGNNNNNKGGRRRPKLWNGSMTTTNAVAAKMDRTDSGIGITRSYEAPNYSNNTMSSYDSENFIVPTTTTHRPIYQPYGGAIPQRHNDNNNNSDGTAIISPPSQRTTTTTTTKVKVAHVLPQTYTTPRSAVIDDSIQNNDSLEYIDRNTGRLA